MGTISGLAINTDEGHDYAASYGMSLEEGEDGVLRLVLRSEGRIIRMTVSAWSDVKTGGDLLLDHSL